MKREDAIRILDKELVDLQTRLGFISYKNRYDRGWLNMTSNDLLYIDFGFISTTHPVTGKKESYLIKPNITISINFIEEHYKKITVNKMFNRPIDFRTVYADVARLQYFKDGIIRNDYIDYDWFINENEDIEKVAPLLSKVITEVIMPNYEKLKTVEQIDQIYNNNLDKLLIYPMHDAARAIRGILAAKLVNNPKLDSLIDHYSKEVPTYHEMYQQEFHNLMKYLKDWE